MFGLRHTAAYRGMTRYRASVTTPHSAQQIASVPGWIVKRPGLDGMMIATRVADLTPYQVERGCLAEISSACAQELEWLCLAQTVYLAMVERAEQLAGRESGAPA